MTRAVQRKGGVKNEWTKRNIDTFFRLQSPKRFLTRMALPGILAGVGAA